MAAGGVAAVGAVLQIYGNMEAAKAQAEAEEKNKKFYDAQAKYALEAAQREQSIFDSESEQFFGSQVNAFVKGGVDISGSALLKLAQTKREISNESANILITGKRSMNLIGMRAQQSAEQASRLRSSEYQFLNTAGPALTAVGSISNYDRSSSSTRVASSGNNYYSGPANSMEILNNRSNS